MSPSAYEIRIRAAENGVVVDLTSNDGRIRTHVFTDGPGALAFLSGVAIEKQDYGAR